MRLLIAAEEDAGVDSRLSGHFGHCPYFAIYDTNTGVLDFVRNALDHSNLQLTPVDQVMKFKPDVVFSLGMGQRALRLFAEREVELKTGDFKTVAEVIKNIGRLSDLSEGCNH